MPAWVTGDERGDFVPNRLFLLSRATQRVGIGGLAEGVGLVGGVRLLLQLVKLVQQGEEAVGGLCGPCIAVSGQKRRPPRAACHKIDDGVQTAAASMTLITCVRHTSSLSISPSAMPCSGSASRCSLIAQSRKLRYGATIWIRNRIASPMNVPEKSSVASPSVLPLPR